MQRLAALVPRPRWHLIRLHGVLAPNAKLGAKVVPHPPAEPVQKVQAQEDNEAKHGRAHLPEGRASFKTSESGTRQNGVGYQQPR
jgi:hypothetical protein